MMLIVILILHFAKIPSDLTVRAADFSFPLGYTHPIEAGQRTGSIGLLCVRPQG